MKSSLLFSRLASAILVLSVTHNLSAQNVVFSEDFSGFTTGSHSSQPSYDYSGVLDSKTAVPGWTGFKIYSAGGEIKLGTADVPGWIETPLIDLSGYEGDLFVRFDISRWPDDDAIVQVSLNGSPLGTALTPNNEFQTIELPLTDGITSAKIKFESLAKRFFLDNIQIVAQYPTRVQNPFLLPAGARVYPNPAGNLIAIENLLGYNRLEISDLNGRVLRSTDLSGKDKVKIPLTGLPPGIYIMRFVSVKSVYTTRLIKY